MGPTMSPPPIYLDHNATSPLSPAVAEAMAEFRRRGHANPASQHGAGREARRVLEQCRERVAHLVGADTESLRGDSVVFTSGGTEANALAILGLAEAAGGASPGRLIVSAIEHPSVAESASALEQRGWRVDRLGVDPTGAVRLEELERLLATPPRPAVVSLMLGNNETGVLQPVREAAVLCLQAGVPLHTDAVQAVGKIPVLFRELGVAALTLTAHKFNGPLGVGALVVRSGVAVAPQLFGGRQQGGLRPGTEPVELVVGLATGLAEAVGDAARAERMAALRDRLELGLRSAGVNIEVVGGLAARLPHTSCLALEGVDRQAMLMALDLAGVACSTGSACASGSSEPSPVLLAMGLDSAVVGSALRFSLGATTTGAEIDDAVGRISRVYRALYGSNGA
jgi:cysteine desulfurase